jgi:hypothetical protein
MTMLKRILFGGSTLALGAAVVGLAVAQTPPPQPPAAQPPARPAETATAKTFRAKDLIGTKMSIRGNTQVGTVDDIVFSDEGVIQYLIVSTGDDKLVTVPWEAPKFDYAQRTAVIDLTPEQFRAIPTYTVRTYPNFVAPTYRTEIYRFYNLTPGEMRRLERRLDRR